MGRNDKQKRRRGDREVEYDGEREEPAARRSGNVHLVRSPGTDPLDRVVKVPMIGAYVQCELCMDQDDATLWEAEGGTEFQAELNLHADHRLKARHGLAPNGEIHFSSGQRAKVVPVRVRFDGENRSSLGPKDLVMVVSLHCAECRRLGLNAYHQEAAGSEAFARSSLYAEHQREFGHVPEPEGNVKVDGPLPRPQHLGGR